MGAATRSEAAKAFYANEDWGAGAMQHLLNHESKLEQMFDFTRTTRYAGDITKGALT